MTKTLLIGSGNPDKSKELQRLLANTDWHVKGLSDFPSVDEPEEDQDTFEGNGLLKARYYSEKFGLPCVADDSGIEVDALDGAPGVYSARYAGEECSYDDNNRKLLEALAELPDEKRGARFVCCAAFVDPQGAMHVERGTVEGRIAHELRGTNGFGYDPLFIPQGCSETFAELEPDVKHSMSHRGRAFRAMCEYLSK